LRRPLFRHQDQDLGLRTRRQIELFRQREAAKRERVQRRLEEAHVRHLNFELVQRIVLLISAMAIAIAIGLASAGSATALKLAIGAGGVWAAIVSALYRFNGRKKEED
jgi:uncharacterized membrane protein